MPSATSNLTIFAAVVKIAFGEEYLTSPFSVGTAFAPTDAVSGAVLHDVSYYSIPSRSTALKNAFVAVLCVLLAKARDFRPVDHH